MPSPEIHRTSITLRRPIGPNDPGAAVWGKFITEGAPPHTVILCDDAGQPLVREGTRRLGRQYEGGQYDLSGRWERKLRPGEDMWRAARVLLLDKHGAEKRGDDIWTRRIDPRRYSGTVV